MKRFLFLFILILQSSLFGCAACSLMTPTAEVTISLDTQDKKLNHAHFKWTFSDLYTQETTTQYDKNRNGNLDEKELQEIKQAFIDYLVPKDMLTEIRFIPNTDEENHTRLKAKYEKLQMSFIDGHIIFEYESKFDTKILDNSSLSFTFEDDEGFFAFVVTDLKINNTELYVSENLYLFTANLLFTERTSGEIETNTTEPSKEKNLNFNASQEQNLSTADEKPVKEVSTQENLLKESIEKIKSLFESIKDEKDPLSYIMLLVFAYIYGVIHAIGPGHGKALVASYFLSNERSYSKALFISLAIGVVHTFSAFLLTVSIYYILNSFLAHFLNDTVFYTTKISAIIIISIALYLLYKKYKAYKSLREQELNPSFKFSTSPHVDTCACSACKVDKNSTDTALIISAGIIPCPGTITIFIFSLSLGLYYAGFLSALVMSLGMSSIIFLSAILSVVVRKKTIDTNSSIKKYLEYGSLAVILTLGILLLLS